MYVTASVLFLKLLSYVTSLMTVTKSGRVNSCFSSKSSISSSANLSQNGNTSSSKYELFHTIQSLFDFYAADLAYLFLDGLNENRVLSLAALSDPEPALFGSVEICLRERYPAASMHVIQKTEVGIKNQKFPFYLKRLGYTYDGERFY